jgi:peptidoglycan/LPS O-acetylase OafA/YrhL
MVFGQHYLQLPWGWAGVDVFFVLSGFLITGILFDTRDDPHRIKNFYVRRTLRIVPLYYGLMLLLVSLWPVFRWNWYKAWLVWPAYLGNFAPYHHDTSGASALHFVAYAVLVSRVWPAVELHFGHFWSLCVEEQFYLVWPWIVFWVRDRRRLIYLCIAVVLAGPLLRVLGSHHLPQYMIDQEVLYRATPFRIDALLLGGLIALLRRGPSARVLLTAARTGFLALSAIVLLWLALNPTARHGTIHYVYPAWRFTWGLTFIDLFAACLILMALESTSITSRIFNLRPLRWLGRISYGAYVFHDILHVPLLNLVQRFTGHPRMPTAALALCTTLLMAWASFRWFESPFMRLKERRSAPESRSIPSPADRKSPQIAFLPHPGSSSFALTRTQLTAIETDLPGDALAS